MDINIESIKRLSELKIPHRNWLEALNQVYALLLTVSPGELICITGPSRAGKTRLIDELETLLIGDNYNSEAGVMPVVRTIAVNCSQHGTFSTKSFAKGLLTAVDHPLYADQSIAAITKVDKLSEDSLIRAFKLTVQTRSVKYLFIDEAQHARYVGRDAQGAYAVMESWKCIAQSLDIILIVVGAYPILEIIRKASHMVGRKYPINLGRYQLNQDDLIEFKLILTQYGSEIDCLDILLENLELLYKGSLGCIGLVRSWLIRAAVLSSVRKVNLSYAILNETRPSDDDLVCLATEIQNGEELLKSLDLDDLSEGKTIEERTEKKPKSKRKPKTKPFNRKADRISTSVRVETIHD